MFHALKSSFLSLVLAALAPAALAQPVFNVKAGLHGSALDAERSAEKVTGRTGWQVGVDARIWGGTAYFQPGAFLHRTSLRLSRPADGGPDPVEADSRLYSLRVPLMLGLRLSQDFIPTAVHLRGGLEARWNLDVQEAEGFSVNEEALEPWTAAGRLELGLDLLFLTLDIGYAVPFSGLVKGSTSLDRGWYGALGISF